MIFTTENRETGVNTENEIEDGVLNTLCSHKENLATLHYDGHITCM